MSSGSDQSGVSWVGAGNTFDGNYATGAYTDAAASPRYGNDYIQIDLPATTKIGAIGIIQAWQIGAPNWVRQNYDLDINSGGYTASGSLDYGNRNKYSVLYEGTPLSPATISAAPRSPSPPRRLCPMPQPT